MGVGSLDAGGAEAAAGDLAEVVYFLPAHAGCGEHNALGQAIAPLHLRVGATDVEQLNEDLVIWAAIVGIEDANGFSHDGARRPANLEDVFVLLTGEDIE